MKKTPRKLSKTRLLNARGLFDAYVEDGKLPGYSCLVAKFGEQPIIFGKGYADVERQKPILNDTIFRLYSMSKPITCLALMQLHEQGHFLLDDPVALYIPEWKDLKVFDQGTAQDYTVKEPERAMTIRDLFTHMAGFTYSFMKSHPVDEIYYEHEVDHVTEGSTTDGSTLKDMVEQLVDLPLQFSPGDQWAYSISTDIIGYLVEQFSGQSLDSYLKQHIFEPLGMVDSGFMVEPEQVERFSACYDKSEDETDFALKEDPFTSRFLQQPTFLSGGSGLVSTMNDYYRFTNALANKGELDGVRIIGREAVECMTSNHLPAGKDIAQIGQGTPIEQVFNGVGFGLGLTVALNSQVTRGPTSKGEYGLTGMATTFFWIDPVEELIGIFVTQLIPPHLYPVHNEFKEAVHQALY